MNRDTRVRLGRCNVCGVRCDAWLCVECSFNSDYWGARQNDDRRMSSATTISRVRQSMAGARIEHDQVQHLAHGGAYVVIEGGKRLRRTTSYLTPQFSREELIQWTAKLAEIDPAYRVQVEHVHRRNAIIERWSAARKYTLFCERWTSLALHVIADHFAGVAREPRRKRAA